VTFGILISLVLGATLDIILLSYGARRLLAERRFSLARTIVAGLAGQALTSQIFTALATGLSHERLPPYGIVIGFGSVGRLDSELRAALQRLLLALDRRDPVALTDALLEVTPGPTTWTSRRSSGRSGRCSSVSWPPGGRPTPPCSPSSSAS
jgi:hypothetical protein